MNELNAKTRVQNSPALAQFEDIIFSDWNEGEEHLEWVATADESEIAEWAEEIRQNENA